MVYVLVGNSKTFHAYSTNQISPCHNFVFCFKNIFDFNNPPFLTHPKTNKETIKLGSGAAI